MGQYYKPANIDKKEYLYTHDFKEKFTRDDGQEIEIGQGLKLMEHSYIGNPVMNAVELLIIPSGKWYKNRLVWAGDYADHEEGYPKRKSEDGKQEYDYNFYDVLEDEGTKLKATSEKVDEKYKYLTNHTKKQVIDLSTVKDIEGEEGWKIHPLSILVAEGNGRGGGDFRGEDERVGSWSRDIISLEDHIEDGYKTVDGNFKESR